MLRNTRRIFSISGIPVRLHWSTAFVVLFVGVGTATGLLPAQHPTTPAAGLAVGGGLIAIGLLGSVLAHEFGHALVARRHQVPVQGIDLWALGGVAYLGAEADNPRAEWRIAAAGPAVSFLLGVAAIALGAALAAANADIAGTLAITLGVLNIGLAVFNLLPAYPLDGGRLLRAALWARRGDRHRATATAAKVGAFGGSLLIALGVFLFLTSGTGLMIALTGWFINSGARQAAYAAVVAGRLAHHEARTLTGSRTVRMPRWTTAQLAYEHPGVRQGRAVLVCDTNGGEPTGYVTYNQLQRLHDRMAYRLEDLAIPLGCAPQVTGEHPADEILQRIDGFNPVVVVTGGARPVPIGAIDLAGALTKPA